MMERDSGWGENIRPIRNGIEISQNAADMDENGEIEQSANMKTKSATPSTDRASGWSFFATPQFSVIVSTIVVLVAAAAMYSSLESKLDAARVEAKADLHSASERLSGDLDKIDSRLDKVDGRFQSVLDKIDGDGRELRSIIMNNVRPNPPPKHD